MQALNRMVEYLQTELKTTEAAKVACRERGDQIREKQMEDICDIYNQAIAKAVELGANSPTKPDPNQLKFVSLLNEHATQDD